MHLHEFGGVAAHYASTTGRPAVARSARVREVAKEPGVSGKDIVTAPRDMAAHVEQPICCGRSVDCTTAGTQWDKHRSVPARSTAGLLHGFRMVSRAIATGWRRRGSPPRCRNVVFDVNAHPYVWRGPTAIPAIDYHDRRLIRVNRSQNSVRNRRNPQRPAR